MAILSHQGPRPHGCHCNECDGETTNYSVLYSFYLPGYRSGGPLRTIANLVDQLGDEFDIRIITREDVFDTKPYSMVKVDAWNTLGNAQVFYASKSRLH